MSGVWGTFRVFPMWEGVWRTFGESLVVVFWGTMRVSHVGGGGAFWGSIMHELFGSLLGGGGHMLEVFRRLKGCHEWEGVL